MRAEALCRRLPGVMAGLAYAGFWAGVLDRPVMAALFALTAWVVLHGISRVKEKVLFEPLVPADAALLGQVFRWPALYIAYVGYVRFALLAAAGAGGVLLLFLAEPPAGWPWLVRLMLALSPIGAFLYARHVLAPHLPLALQPEEDKARYGLISMLVLYAAAVKAEMPEFSRAPLRRVGADAPHIVLIQAESFYDPRSVWPAPYRDAVHLPVWDRLCAEGRGGVMQVPARGANTMRSEFAVLGGRTEEALGLRRFNPFLSVRDAPVDGYPAALAAAGYRTMALHPYDGRFFGRARRYPLMGFQSFMDQAHFRDAPRRGPYVADEALGERIASLLSDTTAPSFIFAVTMENHGPWRRQRYAPEEAARIAALFPDLPFPLAAYVYHLQGTDRMLDRIVTAAKGGGRPLVLGLYGDHPPSFPGLGWEAPVAQTSFLAWPLPPGRRDAFPRHVVASDFLHIFLGEALSGGVVEAGQGGMG